MAQREVQSLYRLSKMAMKYSFQDFDSKNSVKVSGRNMPVSHKQCYEVANFIRGKQIDRAIKLLENVIIQKTAVPYRRYNRDICHKAGKVGPGRYPRKTSEHIIKLLRNLKGQAQDKGLDTVKVFIVHAAMQKGLRLRHYGRKIGTVRKNTNFELVGKEIEKAEKKPEKKQASQEKKTEMKPLQHAVEPAKTQGDNTSHGVKK